MEKIRQNCHRFFKILKKRTIEAEVTTSSVVIAYYLLLSIFPLIITLGSVLPYLKIPPEHVLPYLKEIFPSEIYRAIKPTVVNLLTNASAGILSASAVITLWSSSKSITGIQKVMDKAYGVEPRKNFFVNKFISFSTMILLVIALLVTIIILGLGQIGLEWFLETFKLPTTILDTFTALKWPTVVIGLFVTMFLIYRILPNRKLSFKSIWPGAIFTSVSWLLLSQVFSIYLRHASIRYASYQIIGSIVLMMLWLNIAAMIIILGGVLNATIMEYQNNKQNE